MNPSTSLGTRSNVGMAKPSPLVRQAGSIGCLLMIYGVCRRSVPSGGTQVKYKRRSDIKVGLHEVHIALALGTHDGMVVNAQPGADAFESVGHKGPPTVGNEVDGAAIALTGGIQHRQRDPARLGGSHGTRQHGAGIAVEDDQAPPAVSLQGKVHHPAVDEPILMCARRFEGMRLGCDFGGAGPRGARDIRIDLTVEGYDPLDRPHGEIRLASQTPDAKAAGIGMALLEMINVQHHREPHLARRGLGCGVLVSEAGGIVALKTRQPPGNRRAGDLEKLTDTALTPALGIQRDDLAAGLGPLGMTMVIEERPRRGRRGWQALPEAAGRVPGEAMRRGMKDDPGQFAGPEPVIEAFETLEFLHHGLWHPELAPGRADLLRGWHQAEHPLLGKAAREGPDGFRMGAGFLSALRGGALRVEEQRADEFIALLDGVTERQMRVVRLCMGSHEGSLPCRRSGLGPPERLHTGQPNLFPQDQALSARRLRPSSRVVMKLRAAIVARRPARGEPGRLGSAYHRHP